MTLDEKIEKLKAGYITGKNAFQSDEDRGKEFDQVMTQVVANVRSDAYMAFRLMYESELDEAMRHVSELRFDEGVAACEMQGTVQRPDNPYTREAVARQQAEQNGTEHD